MVRYAFKLKFKGNEMRHFVPMIFAFFALSVV
jgi:hypothetical protein